MTEHTTEPAQALATKTAATPAVIRTPDEFREALARWGDRFNILTPFSSMSGIAASYGIVVSQVVLNPSTAAGDVYDGLPFLKPNERAIAKIGLRKLADGAGMSLEAFRMDPRTIPHYWEVKAVATYTGIHGAKVRREATKEWDLRDGSPQLKGWTVAQVQEARKHGLRNCEARALNAVIREFGIKQKYTVDELRKPFVVVQVAFQPDMSDPAIKRAVTEQALNAAGALYPGQPRALEAPMVDEGPAEPRYVGSSAATGQPPASLPPPSSTAAGAADSSQPAGPDPNEPPSPRAVRIVEVKAVKSGEGRSGKWTLHKVIDSQGVEHSTLDDTIAEAAKAAKASGAWFELHSETKGEYTNLVELEPAGRSPQLPLEGEL